MLASHPNILLDAVDPVHDDLTALRTIIKKLNQVRSADDKARYVQCLRILLSASSSRKSRDQEGSSSSVDVNAQDIYGNTALHDAALSGVEDAVLQLLSNGANICIKNQLREPAFENIMPSTLETFFNSCIRSTDRENFSSQNVGITFDYSLLAPPRPFPYPPQQQQQSEAGDEKILPECETLLDLSISKEHQDLLNHPLLASFIMLKWHNIRKFYYMNLLVYALFVMVLSAYILLLLRSGYEPESFCIPLEVLWYVLGFFFAILVVRVFFQLDISPRHYFFSPENYVDLAMMGCTFILLVQWDDPDKWLPISTIAMWLARTKGLLLLRRHPQLSVYFAMLTAISQSLIELLFCYSFFFIPCALTFYILSGGEKKDDGKEAKESDFFSFFNIPVELFKVIVPDELNRKMIILAYLSLFVVPNLQMVFVLSGVQSIYKKAGTIRYISRVELMSYLESLLLVEPFHLAFALFRRICPSSTTLLNHMRGTSLFRFIRAENAFLFYQCLPNKTFTVYPCQENNNEQLITFRLDRNIFDNAFERVRNYRRQHLTSRKQ